MTPRVDIVAAPVTVNAKDLLEIITSSKHSRIPLYENTLDRIIGFLPSRDFLLDPTRRISLFIRPVLIVPEKASADRVFHDLRKGRWQMAVVVNEYGETVGIVTPEDLVEEVVGELYDEFERTEEEVVQTGPELFEARGSASLQDLGERIGAELPQEQAVTLNGFVCALYGGFPRVGTVIRWEDFEFEVLDAARHRITKVRIRRLEPREAME
jgi:putative hemolysin